MFLDRLHEVAPPPVDPLVIHHRRRKRRQATQWGVIAIAIGIAGAFVWWYYGIGTSESANNNNSTGARVNESVNTNAATTSYTDTDRDGLSDELEGLYGTDALKEDTDGDGFSDGTETENGYDPSNSAKNARMVDLALVETLAKNNASALIISSGLSTADHARYYLLYNGATTAYYSADGSVKAECQGLELGQGVCFTLPNEVRTDFSRTYDGSTSSDAYHIPF